MNNSAPWSNPPRISFETFGCRVNQYESDHLEASFRDAGYSIVGKDDGPDVHVINSCTVTAKADKKSFRSAKNLQEHAGATPKLVVVMGCAVSIPGRSPEPGVLFLNNKEKHRLLSVVERWRLGVSDLDGDETTGSLSVFDYSSKTSWGHTRPMVKIQDGCENVCSFCIIPKARGRAQSRDFNGILEEIINYEQRGYHEVVLTGINMSRYKTSDHTFTTLIREIIEGPGTIAIRLGSVEPYDLGPEFFSLFENPRLMPSIHLCIQSADDQVLAAMNRHYTYAQFRSIVDSLKSINPKISIGTDLMVGFPGETEGQHKNSLTRVAELGLAHIHVFSFSLRRGTRAFSMEGRVAKEVIAQRYQEAQDLANRAMEDYELSLLGVQDRCIVEKVLVSSRGRKIAQGTGRHNTAIYIDLGLPEPSFKVEHAREPREYWNRILNCTLHKPKDESGLWGVLDQ